MIEQFRQALFALKRTQILGNQPWLEVLRFAWLFARHGASLYAIAAWSAQRFSYRVALVSERQLTFPALLLEADALAKQLGFLPRTRVGLLLLNSADFVIHLLACSRLGVDVVLLNPKASSLELAQVLQDEVQVVLCDKNLEHVLPKDLNLTVFIAGQPNKPVMLEPTKTGRRGGITILTSGSTGRPKPIKRQANWQLIPTLTYLLEVFEIRAERRILLTVPMYHGHGLATLMLSLVTGSSLYIFSESKTEIFLDCLEHEQIDVLVLVPTILHRILEQAPRSHGLKMMVTGSAPLEPELLKRSQERFGHVLYNLYGSSETGLISVATPNDLQVAPNSVGKPLPHLQVRLLETIHVFLGGVWIDTKDMGFLENDRLYLLGRQDDLLICGGENVYPQQLEQRILQLPYLQECAVKGLPDPEYGTALELFVVFRTPIPLEALEADLQMLLPRALRPKSIVVLDELPRNAIGKLQRQKL